MPFDGGFSSLSKDGATLSVAAAKEIWLVDALRGSIKQQIALPTLPQGDYQWGYLAESDGDLFATCMKSSARRFSQDRDFLRQSFTSDDYNSSRPLVCSRVFLRMNAEGEAIWRRDAQGVIPHGAITISEEQNRVLLVEGRSPSCLKHESDRVTVADLLKEAYLVCLNRETGELVWEQPLQWENADNMLYTQIADQFVPVVTSTSVGDIAQYHARVYRLDDGELAWQTNHTHVRSGLFMASRSITSCVEQTTGEKLLIVEPYLYQLATGERVVPPGQPEDWALNRPGHSCGTLSGAGHCLFFRASNPTVLNLAKSKDEEPFTKLSPSRPSCWINIIPAAGRLLIPEGSASCVCSYSLQTSMAFVPLVAEDSKRAGIEFLDDVLNVDAADEPLELIYDWELHGKSLQDKWLVATKGDIKLKGVRPFEFTERGLEFDGTQWLTRDFEKAELPEMPRTVSLAADVVIDEGNQDWTALVGALQDNGSYERGCMLGINNDQFFFAVSSLGTGKLTYLSAGSKIDFGTRQRVVGTYDGTVMKLYLNGQLAAVSTEQQGDVVYDKKSWLALGSYKDNNDAYPLKGSMRRVQIYQGDLAAEQATSLFEGDDVGSR